MDLPPDNLYGMAPEAAKEYIAAHVATKLLNEKKLAELEADLKKWTDRVVLARSRGVEDLAAAAEAEAARIGAERDRLAGETQELEGQIERMRRQLPGLEAGAGKSIRTCWSRSSSSPRGAPRETRSRRLPPKPGASSPT
jgi:chromosome segregation ATPase